MVILNIRFWGLIVLAIVFTGCALTQIKEESRQIESRNVEHETRLKQIQAQKQDIDAQGQALREQLNEELSELDRLLEQNKNSEGDIAKIGADIEAQKRRYAELKNRVSRYKKELAYGTGGLDSIALNQKRKEIEILKNEIKTYLGMEMN